MFKIGFDNEKYVELQSQHIRERVDQFGGKLYLEFGGKLFDDYHASRVLPGFEPDSKIRMLKALSEDAEIVIAINADAIEKNKRRGDIGITYDQEVLRLIDAFTEFGLYVGSVVITQFAGQPLAESFEEKAQGFQVVLQGLPVQAKCGDGQGRVGQMSLGVLSYPHGGPVIRGICRLVLDKMQFVEHV